MILWQRNNQFCQKATTVHFRAAAHVINITMMDASSKNNGWLTQESTHLIYKCSCKSCHTILREYLLSSFRGGNEELFLRNNSVCFWMSYSLRNDSIQGFQGLEERVWKVDEATERKTKKYFVEITESARWKWWQHLVWHGKPYYECDCTAAKINYWLVPFLIF